MTLISHLIALSFAQPLRWVTHGLRLVAECLLPQPEPVLVLQPLSISPQARTRAVVVQNKVIVHAASRWHAPPVNPQHETYFDQRNAAGRAARRHRGWPTPH